MSAISNFMEMFFPDYMAAKHQELAQMMQQSRMNQAMQALDAASAQYGNFQPDTFGAEDPINELMTQGNANMYDQIRGGVFDFGAGPQRQAALQGFGALLSNQQTAPLGQAILQSYIPKPTEYEGQLQQYMQAMQLGLIPPGTSFLDFKKAGGTNINNIMGNDKPLGADAANWVNAKGEQPSAMDTIMSATQQGFKPVTTEQRKSMQSATESAPAYSAMIRYGFGTGDEKSLFPPADASGASRAKTAVQSWLGGVTQSDLRVTLYNSQADAMVTGLARLVGQVGTLTDRDVGQVRDLLPVAGLTPDPVAKEKFRQIASLLRNKGIPNDMLMQLGFPDWAVNSSSKVALPKGWTKE